MAYLADILSIENKMVCSISFKFVWGRLRILQLQGPRVAFLPEDFQADISIGASSGNIPSLYIYIVGSL